MLLTSSTKIHSKKMQHLHTVTFPLAFDFYKLFLSIFFFTETVLHKDTFIAIFEAQVRKTTAEIKM